MTPRGAPVDYLPPRVDSTVPADGAVGVAPDEVRFVFPEVVSERPQGATTLGGMFVISPGTGEPRVTWRRHVLAVRPREGWLPNTTYTITMLPGVTDLQNNVSKEGAKVVFSTGASIDSSKISGIIFDWVGERVAARAVIRARLIPPDAPAGESARRDSVVYSAVSDSAGLFNLSNLPDGVFDIRGFIDANSNRQFDSTEIYDSTRVTLTDSARVELLAFLHDPNGPRMLSVTVRDSFTFSVQFSRPIDPAQVLDTTLFRLTTANDATPATDDSVSVPLVLIRPERASDRTPVLSRLDSLRADSIARAAAAGRAGAQRPDSVPAVRQAVMPSRPRPPMTILFQVGTPLTVSKVYSLRATGIRGLLGTSASSSVAVVRQPPPAAGRGGSPDRGR